MARLPGRREALQFNKDMSQLAVIGIGRFGFHVARLLHESGHNVLAVDLSAPAVQRVKDHCTQAVVLDARDKQRVRALGLRDFDAVVISLGERLEASTLIALHLKEIGVKRIIAKAGSTDHAKLLELIGVSEIISPERQAAERLANRLRDTNVLDYIPLGKGYGIHEIIPPKEFLGKSLVELRLRNRFNIQVLAIRDGRTDELKINPSAQFQIHEFHILVVLGSDGDFDQLRKLSRS